MHLHNTCSFCCMPPYLSVNNMSVSLYAPKFMIDCNNQNNERDKTKFNSIYDSFCYSTGMGTANLESMTSWSIFIFLFGVKKWQFIFEWIIPWMSGTFSFHIGDTRSSALFKICCSVNDNNVYSFPPHYFKRQRLCKNIGWQFQSLKFSKWNLLN